MTTAAVAALQGSQPRGLSLMATLMDAFEPPDFSMQYNTPLSPQEEQQYMQWAQQYGLDPQNTRDYDQRGAFKAGEVPSENRHLSDRFKKPNHATFSNESIYHGKEGHVGGRWTQDPQGTWTFQASPTNLQFRPPGVLQQYFDQVEQGNRLVLPGGQQGHRRQ